MVQFTLAVVGEFTPFDSSTQTSLPNQIQGIIHFHTVLVNEILNEFPVSINYKQLSEMFTHPNVLGNSIF